MWIQVWFGIQVERPTVNDGPLLLHGRRLSDAALVTWQSSEGWVIHRLSQTFEIRGESMQVPVSCAVGVPTESEWPGVLAALAEVDWTRLGIRRCWVEIPPGLTVMHAVRVPEVVSDKARKVVWGHHLSEAFPDAGESMVWGMVHLKGDELESTLAVAGVRSETLDPARLIHDVDIGFFVSATLDVAAEWNRAGKSLGSVWCIGSGGLTIFGAAQGHVILRHFPMERMGWLSGDSGEYLPGPDAGAKLIRLISRLESSGVSMTAHAMLLCGEKALVSRLRDVVATELREDVAVDTMMYPDRSPGSGVMESVLRWARGDRLGLIGDGFGGQGQRLVPEWRKPAAVALALVIGVTAIVAGAVAYFQTEQLKRVRSEHAELIEQTEAWDRFVSDGSDQDDEFDPAQKERIQRAEAVRDIPLVWISVFSHLQNALQDVGDVWLDRFDLALSEEYSQTSGNDHNRQSGVIRLAGCMLVREANLRYPVDRQVIVRTKARLERLRSAILSDTQIAEMDGFSANFEDLDQGFNVVGFEMLLRLKTTPLKTVDESR